MANMTIEDIVRALFAAGFLIIFGYVTITGGELSPTAHDILIIVIGFYFGVNELVRFAGKFADRRNIKDS